MSPFSYNLVCAAQFVVGIHKPPEGGDVYELLFFRYYRVCSVYRCFVDVYRQKKEVTRHRLTA